MNTETQTMEQQTPNKYERRDIPNTPLHYVKTPTGGFIALRNCRITEENLNTYEEAKQYVQDNILEIALGMIWAVKAIEENNIVNKNNI